MKDFKVGIFVLMGVILAGLVIFLIGNERRVFESAVEFRAKFDDVEGLRRGAPVQMGGVRVGQVESVGYSNDPTDQSVYVTLSVVEKNAERIRTDGYIIIENKGLLGDKMLEVVPGTSGEFVAADTELPVKKGDDFMGQLNSVATEAEGAIKEVRTLTKTLGDEALHQDLRETMHGMNLLMQQVTEGQGYPNRFLTDPVEADNISSAVENLSKSSRELNGTLREIRLAVHGVRTGPSFAHNLLYGPGPEKEIAQVGFAAEEVGLTLQGIRKGNGFAHDVLYGGESDTSDALANITHLTADLRDIVSNVKAGKGTIGALLVDPSVYEDLKRVLGDVQRNDVLRSLVRYSITQDEKATSVEVGTKEE